MIENTLSKLVNRFRLSPHNFENSIKSQYEIRPNPQANFNPLGTINSLNIFVISDTHYHIDDRKSFDRNINLPTTQATNFIRNKIMGGPENWYSTEKPKLYNKVLENWPAILKENISFIKSPNILTVDCGDMGEDSLNRSELSNAVNINQQIALQINNVFQESWKNVEISESIFLLGDHDVDYRAWSGISRLKQIEWMYDVLGHQDNPSSYFQEVTGKNNTKTGLLLLDTNLLNPFWMNEIKKHVYDIFKKINILSGIDYTSGPFSVNWNNFTDFCLRNNKLDELKDILAYQNIIKQTQVQQKIIAQARELEEVVVIGHRPNETINVAKTMLGKTTAVYGHRHIPFDSNKNIYRLSKSNSSGIPIHEIGLGAAVIGAGGMEIKGKPTAIAISIEPNNQVSTLTLQGQS